MQQKTCTKCGKTKDMSEFYRDKGFKNGHHSRCKTCKDEVTIKARLVNREKYNAYAREYRQTHPEKYEKGRVRSLRTRYGITQEQYDQILVEQGGHCALCEAKPGRRAFHVDHVHSTGVVRGILCPSHNRSMALLDDKELMVKAMNYNENPPARNILKKSKV